MIIDTSTTSILLRSLSFFILARQFHELNQAYGLLFDPLWRLALDAKMRVKQARAEMFKSYDSDNKRRNFVNELFFQREGTTEQAWIQKARTEEH
jgi:DnaJ family protein C protein 17